MPKLRFSWERPDGVEAFLEIYIEYIAPDPNKRWLADLAYVPPGVVVEVANRELANEIKAKAERLGLQVEITE